MALPMVFSTSILHYRSKFSLPGWGGGGGGGGGGGRKAMDLNSIAREAIQDLCIRCGYKSGIDTNFMTFSLLHF
jgi:hypothetical protein